MIAMGGGVSEEPMINFAVHQVRAGSTGAREDFEQMIGLLVRATSAQDAKLIAAPQNWGIDVLLGDLRGPVSVWQAKYLIAGFSRSRLDQIRPAFYSAVRAAADHGYSLERWVLCIPTNMDGRAMQWWHKWEAEQTDRTGIAVELWDEAALRELLLRPESADIYCHYYAPHVAPESGRAVPEQPMINFAAHQVRAGSTGAAREDFEQMIRLLVPAASGQDISLLPAPASWDINAFVGELTEGVTAWQPQYLAQGIRRAQLNQITSSFTAAVNAIAAHGHSLERWVLCTPSSMDGPAMQWWHEWKTEQTDRTGVAVELWDEAVLRELLLRPEAADIYHRYYAPSLRPQVDPGGDEEVSEAADDPVTHGRPTGASGSIGHAFISYVREDSGEVDVLQKMLEAAGIPVWRDTSNLWPGEDWRAKIRGAISRDALVFIACFSSHSAARQQSYQNEELLLAIDQLRRRRPDDPWLIPVRFDDCDVPDFELGAAGRSHRSTGPTFSVQIVSWRPNGWWKRSSGSSGNPLDLAAGVSRHRCHQTARSVRCFSHV